MDCVSGPPFLANGRADMNRITVVTASSVVLAAIITVTLFFYMADNTGSDSVPEAVALHRPVHMSLVYTNPERNYNTLDGSYVQIYEDIIDSRRQCEFCSIIEFHDGPSRAGTEISWSADRFFDIRGTSKVTLYVMGDEGGELVQFKAAGKRGPPEGAGRIPDRVDFDVKAKPITLSSEWQKLEIDLSGSDLQRVTHPLGIDVGEGQTARIWIKGLMLEDEPAVDPLEVEVEEESS